MLTVSPARMRMRCFRILPDMYATTLCPFSSPTRNRVSGITSSTMPTISIVSSLAKRAFTGFWYVSDSRSCLRRSYHLEVDCGHLAVVAALEIERHFLVLAQRREAGALDGRDVDEYVLGAAIRLDEAESLGVVEEFHGSAAAHGSSKWVSPRAPL